MSNTVSILEQVSTTEKINDLTYDGVIDILIEIFSDMELKDEVGESKIKELTEHKKQIEKEWL